MHSLYKISALGVAALLAGTNLVSAFVTLNEDVGLFLRESANGTIYLTDPRGNTVYTYDRSTPGKATCVEACATNWPPALAQENDAPAGKLTKIKRDDGKLQWAYDGKPLYTYTGDNGPGQLKGRDMGNAWRIVPLSGRDDM